MARARSVVVMRSLNRSVSMVAFIDDGRYGPALDIHRSFEETAVTIADERIPARRRRPPARHRRRRPDRPRRRRARAVAWPADRRPRGRPAAGAAVREWGHVRLFSRLERARRPGRREAPRRHRLDPPRPGDYPTGRDWVERYLAPLAAALAPATEVEVRYGHRVVGVAKHGRDRLVDSGRDEVAVHRARRARPTAPDPSSPPAPSSTPPAPGPAQPARRRRLLPAGEAEHADRITYGIPDFTDPAVAAGTPASASPSPAAVPPPRTPSSA